MFHVHVPTGECLTINDGSPAVSKQNFGLERVMGVCVTGLNNSVEVNYIDIKINSSL